MKLIMTDADGFDRYNLCGQELVVMNFRRDAIVKGPGEAVDRLMRLTDDAERAWKLRTSIHFIVEGYDDDPAELYEIPEVVQFFRDVTDQWPYWFHFLTQQKGLQQHTLLSTLLSDVMRIASPDGAVVTVFRSPDENARVLAHLARATQLLYQQHSWPRDALEATLGGVIAALEE